MKYRLDFQQNDSDMLGDKTAKATDKMKPFLHWYYLSGDKIHPAICQQCGRRVDLDFYDSGFVPKKKFDMSRTYDRYLIVSPRAREVIEARAKGVIFHKLCDGQFWLDVRSLSVAEVDQEASGIRKSKFCNVCNEYAEVLLGIELKPIPHAKPLIFKEEVSCELYRSDLEFGSNFGQGPTLFASSKLAENMRAANLTGVEIVEE